MTFRDRLLGGEPLIGSWVKSPSPIVCEVLSQTRLDAIAIDAEHAPFGRLELDGCVAMARHLNMPALVRTPSAADHQLLNALDIGATGVIVPHVKTAAQATDVARACRFGPGGRGYAGSTRSAGYGATPMSSNRRNSAELTTVIAQIEDVEGVEDIAGIAAVEGIDCLFIGRIDLTIALGCDDPDDPAVVEAVRHVCHVCRDAGRRVGMFVARPAEAAQWIAEGASLFLLASDHAFLVAGANALADGFRADPPKR